MKKLVCSFIAVLLLISAFAFGACSAKTGSATVTLSGWTYGETPNRPAVVTSTNDKDSVAFTYKQKDAPDSEYTETVPVNAGDYIVRAVIGKKGRYEALTVTSGFTIAKAVHTVAAPVYGGTQLTYGDPLPVITTTTAGGSIALNQGQTLSAGTHDYNWTFTPTDTANYSDTAGKISLSVNKATPVVAAPTAGSSPIVEGAPLPALTTTTTGGTAALDDGQTILFGTHEYNWTFTPDDPSNYNSVTGKITLTAGAAFTAVQGSNTFVTQRANQLVYLKFVPAETDIYFLKPSSTAFVDSLYSAADISHSIGLYTVLESGRTYFIRAGAASAGTHGLNVSRPFVSAPQVAEYTKYRTDLPEQAGFNSDICAFTAGIAGSYNFTSVGASGGTAILLGLQRQAAFFDGEGLSGDNFLGTVDLAAGEKICFVLGHSSAGDYDFYIFPTKTYKFVTNNGNELSAEKNYYLETAPSLTKHHADFGGWYDNPDFTGAPVAFPYIDMSKPVTTLYAKWTAQSGTSFETAYTANEMDNNFSRGTAFPVYFKFEAPESSYYWIIFSPKPAVYLQSDLSSPVEYEDLVFLSAGQVCYIVAGGDTLGDTLTIIRIRTASSYTKYLAEFGPDTDWTGYVFIPEVTGSVSVASFGSYDAYIEIMGPGVSAFFDDEGYGMDFFGTISVEAGKKYFITLYSYGNLDLYEFYIFASKTYRFESNGGDAVSDVTEYIVENYPVPGKEGFLFGGWYDNPSFTGNRLAFPYINLTGPVTTLYAKWNIAPQPGESFSTAFTAAQGDNPFIPRYGFLTYYKFVTQSTGLYMFDGSGFYDMDIYLSSDLNTPISNDEIFLWNAGETYYFVFDAYKDGVLSIIRIDDLSLFTKNRVSLTADSTFAVYAYLPEASGTYSFTIAGEFPAMAFIVDFDTATVVTYVLNNAPPGYMNGTFVLTAGKYYLFMLLDNVNAGFDFYLHREKTYKFVTNGGSAAGDVTEFILDAKPSSVKDGWYLAGWYDNAALSGDPVGFPYMRLTEPVTTLYAKWSGTYIADGKSFESAYIATAGNNAFSGSPGQVIYFKFAPAVSGIYFIEGDGILSGSLYLAPDLTNAIIRELFYAESGDTFYLVLYVEGDGFVSFTRLDDISLYTKYIASFDYYGMSVFAFTPETSGTYFITTVGSRGVTPSIFDIITLSPISLTDSGGLGSDIHISAELTGGKAYLVLLYPVLSGGAIEIYAHQQKTYKFVTNGGSAAEDITEYYIDQKPASAKDGMYLAGWYDNAALTGNPVVFPYIDLTKATTTLYAKWSETQVADGSSFQSAFTAAPGVNSFTAAPTLREVYFKFVPLTSGLYYIHTDGFLSSVETYRSADLQNRLNFGVCGLTSTETYYFKVTAQFAGAQTLVISIVDATAVSASMYTKHSVEDFSTAYRFIAAEAGTYHFASIGSYDAAVRLYSPDATLIGEFDESPFDTGFYGSLSLTAGQTVYFFLSSYAPADSYDFYIIRDKIYKFETSGGSPVGDITYYAVDLLPATFKEGWYFAGWYDNAALTGEPLAFPYFDFTQQVTTLHAKWSGFETIEDGTSIMSAFTANNGANDCPDSFAIIFFKYVPLESGSYAVKTSVPSLLYVYHISDLTTPISNELCNLTAHELYFIVVTTYNVKNTLNIGKLSPRQVDMYLSAHISDFSIVYSFTASTAGTYRIASIGSSDAVVKVWDSDFRLLCTLDDSSYSYDFYGELQLSAGQTVYFLLYSYDLSDEYLFYVFHSVIYRFATNGGSSVGDITNYIVASAPVTTKGTSTFDGWYEDSDFSGSPVTFPYINLSHPLIMLYAKWDEITDGTSFETAANAVTGNNIFITETANQTVHFRFVPEASGVYWIRSGSQVVVKIYNASDLTTPLAANVLNLTAGTTYYITTLLSAAGTETLFIESLQNSASAASLYTKHRVENRAASFVFTASASGTYYFASFGSSDPGLLIYDQNGTLTGTFNDEGPGSNFYGSITLSAGASIYLLIQSANGSGSDFYIFTSKSYTFVTNGGSAVSTITSYCLETRPVTERSGWYFAGWYDNAALTGSPVTFPYVNLTDHTTVLYAKWSEIPIAAGTSFAYPVTAVAGANAVTTVNAEQPVYFKFVAQTTGLHYFNAGSRRPCEIFSPFDLSNAIGSDICRLIGGETYYIKATYPYIGGQKLRIGSIGDSLSASLFTGYYIDDFSTLYSFTAGTAGTYNFTSLGGEDSYLRIFDSAGNFMFYDDDSGLEMNFFAALDMAAGETVYLYFSGFGGVNNFDFYVISNKTYTFVTNGGSAVSDVINYVLNYMPLPAKEGWYFAGWYNNPSLTGLPIDYPYAALTSQVTTLYAKWVETDPADGKSFLTAFSAALGDNSFTPDQSLEKIYFRFTAPQAGMYRIYTVSSVIIHLFRTNFDNGIDAPLCNLDAGDTVYFRIGPYMPGSGAFTITYVTGSEIPASMYVKYRIDDFNAVFTFTAPTSGNYYFASFGSSTPYQYIFSGNFLVNQMFGNETAYCGTTFLYAGEPICIIFGHSNTPYDFYFYNSKTYIFETYGGSTVADITQYRIETAPVTERTGYTFGGWYDNPAFAGDQITFPYYSLTSPETVLYAKWIPA